MIFVSLPACTVAVVLKWFKCQCWWMACKNTWGLRRGVVLKKKKQQDYMSSSAGEMKQPESLWWCELMVKWPSRAIGWWGIWLCLSAYKNNRCLLQLCLSRLCPTIVNKGFNINIALTVYNLGTFGHCPSFFRCSKVVPCQFVAHSLIIVYHFIQMNGLAFIMILETAFGRYNGTVDTSKHGHH